MTTSPSWWPTWPTTFPDVEAVYHETVPAQFPDLYGDLGSDEAKDIDAIAAVLSLVAQGSQWVRDRIFPQNDSGGLFLPLWEGAFGIVVKGTMAVRQAVVIRSARYKLGTGVESAVRAIFAPVFGHPDDPTVVSFLSADSTWLGSHGGSMSDEGWAKALTSLHIYSAGAADAPDLPSGRDAAEQTKPAQETWSVGQYGTALYDTDGGYDTACWGQ